MVLKLGYNVFFWGVSGLKMGLLLDTGFCGMWLGVAVWLVCHGLGGICAVLFFSIVCLDI